MNFLNKFLKLKLIFIISLVICCYSLKSFSLSKKVFICDNGLICPEYSDDYLTVKTNIYYETGPNKSVLKTMRLEYMNIHKHETFVT